MKLNSGVEELVIPIVRGLESVGGLNRLITTRAIMPPITKIEITRMAINIFFTPVFRHLFL
jgi:hypothetical protein